MQKHGRIILLLCVGLVILVATAIAAFQQKSRNASNAPQQEKKIDDDFGPIADYQSPESNNPIEKAKRADKGNRHKGRFGKIDDVPGGNVLRAEVSDSYLEKIAAIPAAESNVVLIGQIVDAQAYLSPDKTGVYSEFTIQIEELLKNNSRSTLTSGATLIAERSGGRVRLPSGHTQSFTLSDQLMPRVGRRYVLFLRYVYQGDDLLILTGYELRDGSVLPLDSLTRFAAYEHKGEAEFLSLVRNAIAESTSTSPQGGKVN